MTAAQKTMSEPKLKSGAGLQQWIKRVVYTLLLANFAFYIYDDWQIARHTLNEASSPLDWTAAFAASIDELAWFVLLFLFELETYALPDKSFTRARVTLMHGTRLICYLFLAHTLYAYTTANIDLGNAQHAGELESLCELAGQEISFGYNLHYTDLDAINCSSLSSEQDFYLIEDGLVVTDTTGLAIERQLAGLDLVEASTWLMILLIIEIIVRMQERDITRGRLRSSLKGLKIGLYAVLWGIAGYWIYRGHYVYAWDESLWILGFMAIDMNISQWRKEIEQGAAA